MLVEKDRVVSVSYELRTKGFDGEIIETVSKESPLVFITGAGRMLQKFEENLNGSKMGDTFKFMLTSQDAYGEFSEESIVELPIDAFKVNGVLREDLLVVDNIIPMQDQHGNQFHGKVIEVGDVAVNIDFNHPMAGEDLYFTGEVVNIREASQEELSHGHIHQHGCNGCNHDHDHDHEHEHHHH